MKICKLMLKNFRNYADLTLQFSDGINIFIGDNAQGKTNILESIYILSITKSHRNACEKDLIFYGKDYFSINAEIENDGIKKKISVRQDMLKKSVYLNDNNVTKIAEYIRNFNIILFSPVDLELIKGSPVVRRNKLNIDLCLLYPNFMAYLSSYNKLLKIKNDYLKKLSNNSSNDYKYLDIINNKIVDLAVKIYKCRFEYFIKINAYLKKNYQKVSLFKNLSLNYKNNLGIDDFDENKIREILFLKFSKNLKKEMAYGMCLYGPHRDDFDFILNEKELRNYGSQGQQRISVIAFKLAEIMLYKEMLGDYPVLLLDDVFSEMDFGNRDKLLSYLVGNFQTIITTTDINDFDEFMLKKAKIFKVKNGKVTNYKRKGAKNGKQ